MIDVDFEIGAEAIDYVKMADQEKLKPMEVELRKLEDQVGEILRNMEHLKAREERMRNTNGKDHLFSLSLSLSSPLSFIQSITLYLVCMLFAISHLV
jgi:hypothetical protein